MHALRFPTDRRTKSASARIKSGESFNAGIMWNSAMPCDSALLSRFDINFVKGFDVLGQKRDWNYQDVA